MSLLPNEYDVYSLYLAMRDEIENISYIDGDEQIDAIIYCINYMCDYNIELENSMYNDFIDIVKKSCKDAFDNLNYPPIEFGESEMCYIEELHEAKTIAMIEAAIIEFNKYFI